MPRIAYIALEPFPNAKGSGTRISVMTRGLVAAGYDVHLISLAARTDETIPSGVEYHPVRLQESNFLTRSLRFRDDVARRLRAIRPDIIHFRGVFEGQAALDYGRVRPIKTVFEANGLPSIELQYHYPAVGSSQSMLGKLRQLEQETLASVDMALTQSHTTLHYLRDRGLPSSTLSVVIPNGATIQPPSFVSSREAATVFYAGTLAPWQGVPELLMAIRRCNGGRPVRLIMAGPVRRRWRAQIERILKRLKIEPMVEMLGAIHRDELPRLIEQADVCVAPLRRDLRNRVQGCSPIKLFEYMAAAKPVLTTDLPCVREIVDESRGILLRAPTPKQMSLAIGELLDDPERGQQLGKAAQAWIRAGATWSHRVDDLRDAYRRLEHEEGASRPRLGSSENSVTV